MKHLHFDCASGAAGDMVVASLIDLGVDFMKLREAVMQMPLASCNISVSKVVKSGISATRFIVEDNNHSNHGSHNHEHHHGSHRHLGDMVEAIESGGYSEFVVEKSIAIITAIADAEAKIHGKKRDEVHFHEISGVDTLADVVGACLALEMLGIDRVSCSALTVGSGTVRCAHGELPLPAPATMQILASRNVPFRQVDTGVEMLTPTGAAILVVFAESFGSAPVMNVIGSGFGAGSRDVDGIPNVLRAVVGERIGSFDESKRDSVFELCFVVDDMTPEQVSFMLEKCFAAGALDAYAIPATMKKNRLGVEITVLSSAEKFAAIQRVLFKESSTFGMRVRKTDRVVLQRDFVEVEIEKHAVKVKVGMIGGAVVRVQPEYEDCRRVADLLSLPIVDVFALVCRQAESYLRERG